VRISSVFFVEGSATSVQQLTLRCDLDHGCGHAQGQEDCCRKLAACGVIGATPAAKTLARATLQARWCSPSQTSHNHFCHVATMPGNHSRAALREEWESSVVGFLAAELEIAKTFIKLARDSRDPHRQTIHIANAQKACDAVKHFLERAPLPAIETLWIRGELDSIEPSLRSLRPLALQMPRA